MLHLFSYDEVKILLEYIESDKSISDFCKDKNINEADLQQMVISHNRRLESLKKSFDTREERLKRRFEMQMDALKQQREQAIDSEKEQQDRETANSKLLPKTIR